jgi:hypothetical protein
MLRVNAPGLYICQNCVASTSDFQTGDADKQTFFFVMFHFYTISKHAVTQFVYKPNSFMFLV